MLTSCATSRMSVHRGRLLRAKKSSMRRVPILKPLWLVDAGADAHLLELDVHLLIVLVILDQLDDERAIRERKKLGILV